MPASSVRTTPFGRKGRACRVIATMTMATISWWAYGQTIPAAGEIREMVSTLDKLHSDGDHLLWSTTNAAEYGRHSKRFAQIVTRLEPFGPVFATPLGQCFATAVEARQLWSVKLDIRRSGPTEAREAALVNAKNAYSERRTYCLEQIANLPNNNAR